MPTHCPKCQRERTAGEGACARCGLLVTRWEGFRLEGPRLDPAHPVARAWTALEAAWQDDAAHRRFLEQAATFDALDVAAALYRVRAHGDPLDGRARDGLGRAAVLAQELYVARSREAIEAARGPRWMSRVVLVTVALLAVGLGLFVARLFARR